MLWKCSIEDFWESLELSKEVQSIDPKGNQSWIFIGGTDAEAETPIFWPLDAKKWLIWKDPDAGKDWKWEEKGMTGWDGWMASPMQWIWVWGNSGSWWWTGKPGVLQSMGSQRVGYDWATELNWINIKTVKCNGWLRAFDVLENDKKQWRRLITNKKISVRAKGSLWNRTDRLASTESGRQTNMTTRPRT